MQVSSAYRFRPHKASGFYGIMFLYMAVMAAVHAVILGAGVIAEEERDKTSEFLYAKPVSRSRALTGKLLAGLTNLVVLNLVTLASSFVFVGFYGKGETFTEKISRADGRGCSSSS